MKSYESYTSYSLVRLVRQWVGRHLRVRRLKSAVPLPLDSMRIGWTPFVSGSGESMADGELIMIGCMIVHSVYKSDN